MKRVNGGGFASLYSFQDGADGAFPDTALVLAGTTLFGATDGDNDSANAPNRGTIFGLNTTGGNFTVLSTSSISEVILAIRIFIVLPVNLTGPTRWQA